MNFCFNFKNHMQPLNNGLPKNFSDKNMHLFLYRANFCFWFFATKLNQKHPKCTKAA